MERWSRPLYARPARTVARDLLGTVLVRREPEGELRGRIVETEAYEGQDDPASHAFRGPTPRTRVMFGPPGRLYVYRSYGMHWCLNVVTDQDGTAGAVLVRALEPLAGIDIMRGRRGRTALTELCSGPGKLCQAYGITGVQNGADLQAGEIWIEADGRGPATIETTPRVGLSAARERCLRYVIAGNPFVSRGRSAGPRPVC